MAKIRGITVTLYETTQESVDPFGFPVETEKAVTVDNVLVGYPESDEIVSAINLYGKRIQYTLGIPKGDTHKWENKKISFVDAYGNTHTCMTFGAAMTGVEANIPASIPWHKKVYCESYESVEN